MKVETVGSVGAVQLQYNFWCLLCFFCALIGVVFVNRDGLLFELENGKPKLILLSHGETFKLL